MLFRPLITYEDYIDTQDQGFERLRFIVIGFVNRYSYEGIPEILKAEESFENKKSEGGGDIAAAESEGVWD